LEAETVSARQQYDEASAALSRYHAAGDALRGWFVAILTAVLVAGLLVGGLLSLARRVSLARALPYAVGAALAAAFVCFAASVQLGTGQAGALAFRLGEPVWT